MIQFLGLPTTWGYPKTEVLEGPKNPGSGSGRMTVFFPELFFDVEFL